MEFLNTLKEIFTMDRQILIKLLFDKLVVILDYEDLRTQLIYRY